VAGEKQRFLHSEKMKSLQCNEYFELVIYQDENHNFNRSGHACEVSMCDVCRVVGLCGETRNSRRGRFFKFYRCELL